MNSSSSLLINATALGRASSYPKTYDPELLQPIPRSLNRDRLGLGSALPFDGYDLWNCYEISFLNANGLPVAALGSISIPSSSPNLIESKSLKLYLNSLNFTRYDSLSDVVLAIRRDLCEKLEVGESAVDVRLSPATCGFEDLYIDRNCKENASCVYDCLETEASDISIDSYDYDPRLLELDGRHEIKEERLCSHLLKSNCLVTGQPDWGSVFISYKGPKISRPSLLKYLVSFRNHNEFHEMCVERIFTDIMRRCHPESLTVFARYTRRGGIDINPFRSNYEKRHNVGRQIRQ